MNQRKLNVSLSIVLDEDEASRRFSLVQVIVLVEWQEAYQAYKMCVLSYKYFPEQVVQLTVGH